MPFLEFLGQAIVWIIGIGLIVVILGVYVVAGGFILLVTLFTGWIPILACATDPEWNIRWSDGSFVENWAFIAMWEYVVVALWAGFLAFVRPDPDGLPPGLKFLAVFYRVPGVIDIQQAARSGNPADLSNIGDALQSHGFISGIFRKMETWKYRKVAKELGEEADYREAKAEFARKAAQMERARMKMEEAELRRKKYE